MAIDGEQSHKSHMSRQSGPTAKKKSKSDKKKKVASDENNKQHNTKGKTPSPIQYLANHIGEVNRTRQAWCDELDPEGKPLAFAGKGLFCWSSQSYMNFVSSFNSRPKSPHWLQGLTIYHAFAFNSMVKAKKLQARATEKEQKRLHVPTVDRSTGEPAPYVIVVQGPPKFSTSKTCLQNQLGHGKQRRLQFVECPNDINGMIDAAKFADLALLLIDGSYVFEMFKDVKKLKKTKQLLKHRFWTEIYDGDKLFYLSGLIHGKYSKREVHNLARFISVMKFPPLSWRMSHPYIVVDRFEDLTPPEKVCMDNKCDRNVILYGYLRGCIEAKVRAPCKVHIAGVGDYSLAGITALPDPCPLPSAAKKKGLRDKEKLFYAPMSGFGDLLYDKDVVYTIINDHFVQFSKVDETAAVGSRRDTVGTRMVVVNLMIDTSF
ncbi:hypothetical protein KY285_002410 [Solanum tuberosum]|nr:hypothetical protein KY285_002410 [Solanum tuberosum]